MPWSQNAPSSTGLHKSRILEQANSNFHRKETISTPIQSEKEKESIHSERIVCSCSLDCMIAKSNSNRSTTNISWLAMTRERIHIWTQRLLCKGKQSCCNYALTTFLIILYWWTMTDCFFDCLIDCSCLHHENICNWLLVYWQKISLSNLNMLDIIN